MNPLLFSENLDVPLFLPPLIFSRTDTPQISVLKKGNRDEDPTEKASFAATNRASRCTNGIPITFSMTEPIPMKPKENMSNVLKVNLIQQEHYDIIHQVRLFTSSLTSSYIMSSSSFSKNDQFGQMLQ